MKKIINKNGIDFVINENKLTWTVVKTFNPAENFCIEVRYKISKTDYAALEDLEAYIMSDKMF
ncbi:MAG: hypothetical protein LBP62_06640 [Clostridiales bacterium]|jgi:hypothetical protein|nr:hypothetical protein [Clostridiales bacterium]